MEQRKRPRGRPKGSEIDDSKALATVAEMIVADPSLKPTTAMRRYSRNANEATIRRWQSKWKARSEGLLANARELQIQRKRRSRSSTSMKRGLRGSAIDSLESARALMKDSAVQAALDFQRSPGMQLVRSLQNDPAFKMARDLQNSPALRMIRELQNSPAMRAIREYEHIQKRLHLKP